MTASPRRVLVDGYNLLHAVPRFAPRGRDVALARASLEQWLAGEALRRSIPEVVVVWDGTAPSRRRTGPIVVEVTGAGVSADSRILHLARTVEPGEASRTWVVSSDGDVAGPARQLGLVTLGAMTFYRRWTEAEPTRRARQTRRGRKPLAEDDEEKPRPTRPDVDRMLEELLGHDDKGGA